MNATNVNYTPARNELQYMPIKSGRKISNSSGVLNQRQEVEYDEFYLSERPKSRKKSQNNKKSLIVPRCLLTALAAVGVLAGARACEGNNKKEQSSIEIEAVTNDLPTLPTIQIETEDLRIPSIIIETNKEATQQDIPQTTSEIAELENIEETQITKDKVKTNQVCQMPVDYGIQAQELLEQIKELDKDSAVHLSNLENSFNGVKDIEILEYLIYLCNSSKWGNGCIDPLTLYAQICQESVCKNDALGDYSETKEEYLALGFGQFHKCAVDEVNNRIKIGFFGDNSYNDNKEYTYLDRKDPKKALEMMILLLRYDRSRTDSTEAMLAMYNRGSVNGINSAEGKQYVKDVYKHINK